MAVNYEQEILELVRTLSDDQKQQALDYLRVLKRPKGELGWKVIQHSRELDFDLESLEQMERAIDEAFEVIEDFPEVNLDD
jgi:hypothetical protein